MRREYTPKSQKTNRQTEHLMMLNSVLLLAFYVVFHAPLVACSFNWASFPVCAQPAMQDNAPQSCDYGADVSSTNFCLCSDNSFIDGAATEIYTSCGCAS